MCDYRFFGAFDDFGLLLNTDESNVLNGGFSSDPLWKFLVFRLGSLFSSKCGASKRKSCWKRKKHNREGFPLTILESIINQFYLRPCGQLACWSEAELPVWQAEMSDRHTQIFGECVGEKIQFQILELQQIDFWRWLGRFVEQHNFGEIEDDVELEDFTFAGEFKGWNGIWVSWRRRIGCRLQLSLIRCCRHYWLEIFTNQCDLNEMWNMNFANTFHLSGRIFEWPEETEAVWAQIEWSHIRWQINAMSSLPCVDTTSFGWIPFVVINVRDSWDAAENFH